MDEIREIREEERRQTTSVPSEGLNIDWSTAFQSPEFRTGLQKAVTQAIGAAQGKEHSSGQDRAQHQHLASQASTMERMGDFTPGLRDNAATGMLNAPSFISIAESGAEPCSYGAASSNRNDASLAQGRNQSNVFLTNSSWPQGQGQGGLSKAFILGPGRPPIPEKIVSQILAFKVVEMTELSPENLESPTTETPSFTIEGATIIATKSARKKTEVADILTWVECFNSYVSVITYSYPNRARDLLAYMALIIRLAKRFRGRCWYDYDRAFRLEAAASSLQDWSTMKTDLYNYHTSVGVKNAPPLSSSNREPWGDQQASTSCRSWNLGACSSPRTTCKFRHRCNRDGCDGPHRQIFCKQPARGRDRSPAKGLRSRRAQAYQ